MCSWKIACSLTLALGVLAGAAGFAPVNGPTAPAAPMWSSDYDAACKVARQSGKLLFVAFR
jgi:hypothetical protein